MRIVYLLSLLAFAWVRAQDDTVVSDADVEEILSNEAEGVEVKYVLPKYPSKLVPIGETVDVLVGLRNGASDTLNVTYIWGTLSNENYAQNLTTQPLSDFFGRVGQSVEASKEGSFLYRFLPAVQLPPGPYQVALHVAYEASGEVFFNTFFNSTIELVEKTGPLDFQLLFLVVMIVGTCAAVTWAYYELVTDPVIVKLAGKSVNLGKMGKLTKPKAKPAPATNNGDHLASFLPPSLKKEKSEKGTKKAQ